jgi:ABC-type branched-subunit amino acid transport system ATPase component
MTGIKKLLLEIKNLDVSYGFLQILWGISLVVEENNFVSLVGPNGAGKSTTLRTIAGYLTPKSGSILFGGKSIAGLDGTVISRDGISYISEELNLFPIMTIRENLLMGAYTVKDKRQRNKRFDFVFSLFPRLKERENQLAGTLSGGERKMLGIARGMMSSPRLLLVDEPSLGLAPQMATGAFRALQFLNETGVTILLVEQNVRKTLQITNRGYVIERGKIVLEGSTSALRNNEHIKKIYLGG